MLLVYKKWLILENVSGRGLWFSGSAGDYVQMGRNMNTSSRIFCSLAICSTRRGVGRGGVCSPHGRREVPEELLEHGSPHDGRHYGDDAAEDEQRRADAAAAVVHDARRSHLMLTAPRTKQTHFKFLPQMAPLMSSGPGLPGPRNVHVLPSFDCTDHCLIFA